jgi:small-conductance mechanosensitive channel
MAMSGVPVAQAGNAASDATDLLGRYLPEGLRIPEWLVAGGLALLVLVLAYYASTFVRRVFGRRIARRFQRPAVSRTLLRSVQTIVLLLGGALALQILGVPLGDLALSVTVFSAVAGFVLAPIIGSVINGLFVLSERAYEIGDMIYLSDREVYGFVEDITLKYTKVFTLDNTFLVVPNGSIRERDVVNFSAEDSRTRLQLDVQVTYESDIAEARKLIEESAAGVDKVIKGGPDIRIGSARYPAKPTCYIDAFDDHGVNLRLRYWVAEPYKLLTLRSNVQTAIWERLADADMELAYPHNHLYFDDTSGELQVSMRERGPEFGPEYRPGERPGEGLNE